MKTIGDLGSKLTNES